MPGTENIALSGSLEPVTSDRMTHRVMLNAGLFIVALYAFYDLYINSLYIFYSDKGGFRSAKFYLFIITGCLFLFTNFKERLITSITKGVSSSLMIAFILYFTAAILFASIESPSEYLSQLLGYVLPSFILGYIATSDLERNRVVIFTPNSAARLFVARHVGIIVTSLYFIASAYFIFKFLSIIDDRYFMIRITQSAVSYYQPFGDAFIIAFISTAGIQLAELKSRGPSDANYVLYVLLILFETLLAFVCLQLVGSNKAPVTILMITPLLIYYGKPTYWMIRGLSVRRKILMFVPVIIVFAVVVLRYSSVVDLSALRLFDFGESKSLTESSSLQSRIGQVENEAVVMLTKNPVFGKLTKEYIHSSVFSVQTHLGIIGSILLWSFVLVQLYFLHRRSDYEILKCMAIPILVMGAMSSFFTWDPLWFLFGSLFSLPPVKKSEK